MAVEIQACELSFPSGTKRKFFYRKIEADLGVVRQIFVNKDYSLDRLRRQNDLKKFYSNLILNNKIPLIIDAGANIGASSVWFSGHYPRSRIVAFEPDEKNFVLLKKNTDGLNVDARQQAVGSTNQKVRILDEGRGEWGFTTRADNNGDCQMVAMADVVSRESNMGAVPFIAKIDIEGGEKELFEQNADWVKKFPLIVIELHDWMLPGQGTALPFLRCVAGLNRDFVYIGENIFSIAHEMMDC